MEPTSETEADRPLLQRGRRVVLLAVLIAAAAGVMALWASRYAEPARARDVTLLYIGAEDCAPCRAWQTGDGASFRASAEFPRIRYREIKSPHLTDVLDDDNWPEELRVYRSQLRRSDGVPLWLVISGDRIVERRFGASAWRENVLPTLKSLLGPTPT